MRKADYSALASIIHGVRSGARVAQAHAGDDETRAIAVARHQAATDIARDFARAAAVDTHAFLMACGVD